LREYNKSVNLFQGEVRFLTGGNERKATSPRAIEVESVRFRYRRYSPDERNTDWDFFLLCDEGLESNFKVFLLT